MFPTYITGRLQRVTLPTGGYYDYQYPYDGINGTINCSDGSVNKLMRTINDGSSSVAWDFGRAGQRGQEDQGQGSNNRAGARSWRKQLR